MDILKILAVSDVESRFIWDYFDPMAFAGVEMIISCGDLDAKYLSYLVTMLPVPLFYVPGNHDKKYIMSPPEGCENIDGRIVSYRGVRMLGFGGCKSPNPTIYEYSEKQMAGRVKKVGRALKKSGGFDILVTHAPAFGLGDTPGTFHEGFEVFRTLDEVYHPSIHFFGHRHMSGSPVKKDASFLFGDTVMINATGYRIVDLETVCQQYKDSGHLT